MDVDVTGRLLIIYSVLVKYLRKNGNALKRYISYLQASRKPVFQLAGRYCIIFSLSVVFP